MPGKFFWYDVMAEDTDAAAKFYADVIGWETMPAPNVPAGEYTLFTAGGEPVAGLMQIPAEVKSSGGRPSWMGYVRVDDVDAAAARIAQEGGTIHRPPTDVPGVLRFAVVADPQGAVFLIAHGLTERMTPEPAPGTPGTVGWCELLAADWQAVFGFYERMFGWTRDQVVDMGPMGTYQLFRTGGEQAGGMMNKPGMIPHPFWGFYFRVPAIDAAASRATAGGGSVTNGPMQVPGGDWIVNCMDPQGAAFSLVSRTR